MSAWRYAHIASITLLPIPTWAQTSVFTVLGNLSPHTDSTGQVWAAYNSTGATSTRYSIWVTLESL